MLIATRALLGVAGATIAPSTLSLIRNMFLDPKQRTTAISIWIMSFSLGAASGISETCAEFGGALGIAIFGSIGVAIYRSMLAPSAGIGLSSEVRSVALSTLGGAVAVSHQLPAQLAAALVGAARAAFVQGLVLCTVISGVGSLAFAIYAARMFRRAALLPLHTAEHEIGIVAGD